jgi:hypothetical protein
MVMQCCALTLPGAITAGQWAIQGTRMPPSVRSILPPTRGQLSEKRSPPLSLVKTIRVSRSSPPARSSVHQAADAFVHVVDHAAVGVDVAAVQVEQVVLHLLRQRFVVARFPGPVRRGVVQAQEERRAGLPRAGRHALHIVDRARVIRSVR